MNSFPFVEKLLNRMVARIAVILIVVV